MIIQTRFQRISWLRLQRGRRFIFMRNEIHALWMGSFRNHQSNKSRCNEIINRIRWRINRNWRNLSEVQDSDSQRRPVLVKWNKLSDELWFFRWGAQEMKMKHMRMPLYRTEDQQEKSKCNWMRTKHISTVISLEAIK
jgi:hypothetical protein